MLVNCEQFCGPTALVVAATHGSGRRRALSYGLVRPHKVFFAEADLADNGRCVANTRWPDGETSTTHALANFVTEINGLDLAFIHVRFQQRESAAA
jgi:hypothetical protein